MKTKNLVSVLKESIDANEEDNKLDIESEGLNEESNSD